MQAIKQKEFIPLNRPPVPSDCPLWSELTHRDANKYLQMQYLREMLPAPDSRPRLILPTSVHLELGNRESVELVSQGQKIYILDPLAHISAK